EDEGMYTLRVNTKSGFDTYSAYVFVREIPPLISMCGSADMSIRFVLCQILMWRWRGFPWPPWMCAVTMPTRTIIHIRRFSVTL
ncbi:hypothetical protein XENOCAPTIV_020330, partial [Xenoophorus captivus]